MALRIISRGVTPAVGVGKPDYTREISNAIQRAGLRLHYDQGLRIFGRVFSAIASPWAWITPVLAPAATASLIDTSNGQVMPYTIPVGHTMSFISAGGSMSEDTIVWLYLEGFLILSGGLGLGGDLKYTNTVVGFTSANMDPTGATSHQLDIQVTNRGTGNLEGGLEWIGLLEDVGTPPLPTTKTVKCKFCGYEEAVPLDTVHWICPKCGKLNLFYNLSQFKKSA